MFLGGRQNYKFLWMSYLRFMHKSATRLPKGTGVILFDGHCNLCNGAVRFIINRDKKEYFRYASLSWPIAKACLRDYPEYAQFDSILLYEQNKIYAKSTAALRIAGKLDGMWPLLKIFIVVPRFIRDAVYDWIAKNRYRWFGKKSTCMIPETRFEHLFLDET